MAKSRDPQKSKEKTDQAMQEMQGQPKSITCIICLGATCLYICISLIQDACMHAFLHSSPCWLGDEALTPWNPGLCSFQKAQSTQRKEMNVWQTWPSGVVWRTFLHWSNKVRGKGALNPEISELGTHSKITALKPEVWFQPWITLRGADIK